MVVVSRQADWMDNSSPPWAAYPALMACRLVALDKSPGVRPVGIWETLRRALAKPVMKAAGYQAKTACGNLQLCAGLGAGIEGATPAVGQRRLEGVRRRRNEEEVVTTEGEEESQGVAGLLNNLNIETGGTEEKAAEGLEVALGMEVDGDDKDDGARKGAEDGDATIRALGAIVFLTQDAEPSRITLADACNGFNKLIRLTMLWTVRHRCPAGARFVFNCYRCWEQLLLRQPGEPPVIILSQEGVTQGYPLSMVLYGITLTPLTEEIIVADTGLLLPLYADDAAFDSSPRQNAQVLKLLM